MGSTISLRCHGKGMTLNLPGTPIMEAAVVPESVCGTLIDTAFSDAGVSVECQQLVKAISQSLFHAAANHMEHLVSDKIIAVIYPGHLPGSCKALDFQLAGYPSDVYFYLSIHGVWLVLSVLLPVVVVVVVVPEKEWRTTI